MFPRSEINSPLEGWQPKADGVEHLARFFMCLLSACPEPVEGKETHNDEMCRHNRSGTEWMKSSRYENFAEMHYKEPLKHSAVQGVSEQRNKPYYNVRC
jgi:hypothetical protein